MQFSNSSFLEPFDINTVLIPRRKLLVDPENPRRSTSPEGHNALVESIHARGLLLPLRVKPANAQGLNGPVTARIIGRREGVQVVPEGKKVDQGSMLMRVTSLNRK
jgi:hypothetical protein